jgi:hypothetical protein
MNDRPRIEKLRRDHSVDLFDCRQEALNRFLVRYAFQNQQAEASQTYVALVGDDVVGFYTAITLGDMIGPRSRTDRRSIPECVRMEHGDPTH